MAARPAAGSVAQAPTQRWAIAASAKYVVARRADMGTAASKESQSPKRSEEFARRKNAKAAGPRIEGSRKKRKHESETVNAVITVLRKPSI
jgi:hypothetical protein